MLITQTPLRISFLGGGTDFEDFYLREGGAVLSTAINLCAFIWVKERYDDMIYVNSLRKEIAENVDEIQHELVREAMKIVGIERGIEVTLKSDIPSFLKKGSREPDPGGAGLGSSSSFTVGLLHAFYAYKGELKDPETLAREACQIEIEKLRKSMGRQDQYIAAYGNMRFISFSKEGIKLEKLELPREEKVKFQRNLMLFDTMRRREADPILSDQKRNIENRLEEHRYLKELAYQGKDALLQGRFNEIGELLHANWEYKKRLSEKIANRDVDKAYEAARRAGAIGGKIGGAGGGGFLILYCPMEKQEEVRSALKPFGYKEYLFKFEDDGSKVIFNYRR